MERALTAAIERIRLASGLLACCLLSAVGVPAQQAQDGPPRNPAFFPLSQIHEGQTGTAWTVFQGSKPEPMDLKILGILRGGRGPGQDMILAQLLGSKPQYTGVVEGMSGSPVYIDGKLVGALSYRIGQFAKDPIAGITPIEQMIEVRNLPAAELLQNASSTATHLDPTGASSTATTFQAMETPLSMSGFNPAAMQLWQKLTAGTALETVAAGGMGSGSSITPDPQAVTAARSSLMPGSAVSMQLIRGDLEASATCTVTYVDAQHLLACGHPVLGAGSISLPMTTTNVVATLASPLNAFKIINTGVTVGAFNQDRQSAIRGTLGATASMIPVHIAIDAPEGPRKVNVEILDLPSTTPTAVEVVLYNSLLQNNQSTDDLSYHVTGKIDVADIPSVPLDLWASSGDNQPAPMLAAILAGDRFNRLYANGARQGAVKEINLHVTAIPRHLQVALDQAHLVSTDMVHAGDTIEVEATLRPWQKPEHNVRLPIKLPTRLAAGNVRLLVCDGPTLDRTLLQPRPGSATDLAAVLAEARNQHSADRIYVSLLAPEAQGEINGQTLTSLPLSVANTLEPLRDAQKAGLNGESAQLLGDAPIGGVLSGFQILNLHIENGGAQ